MNREELLLLLETFDQTAPTNWYFGQYRDFPANKFIMADYTAKNPNASGSDSPVRQAENILPTLEVIWPGFDFCQMLSALRNNIPAIIQFLKDSDWNPSIPSNKCKCGHWKWQHMSSLPCIGSKKPEDLGCRCSFFEASDES